MKMILECGIFKKKNLSVSTFSHINMHQRRNLKKKKKCLAFLKHIPSSILSTPNRHIWALGSKKKKKKKNTKERLRCLFITNIWLPPLP
jgi:hypothetical protein